MYDPVTAAFHQMVTTEVSMSSGISTRLLQSKTDSAIAADSWSGTSTLVQKHHGPQRSPSDKAGCSSNNEYTSPLQKVTPEIALVKHISVNSSVSSSSKQHQQ